MRRRGYLDEATYAAVIGRPAPAPSPLDWLLGHPDSTATPATAPAESTAAPASPALSDTSATTPPDSVP